MIDACIRSVGEPQLDRCLFSVRGQRVFFSHIHHVEGIVPESEALRALVSQVSSPWMMLIDGDMILHPNAVEEALHWIRLEPDAVEFQFGLYDPFLRKVINSCRVSRTDIIRDCTIKDWLGNDLSIVRQIEEKGYKIMRFWKGAPQIVIGTHFEDPSDFQIFIRFYHAGVARTAGTERLLLRRFRETGDGLALKAWKYGLSKPYKDYPGSRNIDHDRREYEAFTSLSGREIG